MSKSKFGMKEQPKTKQEPNLRELGYRKNQELSITGEQFMELQARVDGALTNRAVYTTTIVPSEKGNITVQGYGQSGQDDDLVAISQFLMNLHKKFVEQNLATPYKTLQEELTKNAE